MGNAGIIVQRVLKWYWNKYKIKKTLDQQSYWFHEMIRKVMHIKYINVIANDHTKFAVFCWKSVHDVSKYTALVQSLQNYLVLQQRSACKDQEFDFSFWNFSTHTFEWLLVIFNFIRKWKSWNQQKLFPRLLISK